MIAVGLGLLVFAAVVWVRVRRARSWQAASARIESAGLREDPDADDDEPPALEVHYVFDVDGRPYRGDRPLLVGTWWLTRKRTYRLARRFKSAATAVAYFDPANPANNCLDRDGHGVAGWLAVVGIAFLLVALFELGL